MIIPYKLIDVHYENVWCIRKIVYHIFYLVIYFKESSHQINSYFTENTEFVLQFMLQFEN